MVPVIESEDVRRVDDGHPPHPDLSRRSLVRIVAWLPRAKPAVLVVCHGEDGLERCQRAAVLAIVPSGAARYESR
jgi:hypothetical protein